MQKYYVRTFGTNSNGNKTLEYVSTGDSAGRYSDQLQGTVDSDLLNRDMRQITVEDGQKLILSGFQLEEVGEGQYAISFEARTEPECYFTE